MRTVTYVGRSVVFPDLPQHQGFFDKLEQGRWKDMALQFIDRFVDESINFVDIGGWIGVTPFWAAQRAGSVVVVEPDPVCVSVLKEMNSLNTKSVEIIDKAVANDKIVSIVAVKGFGSSESSALAKGAESVQVQTIRIADILGRNPRGRFVIKIDIEGYEYMILNQLENIDSFSVKAVMVAMHPSIFLDSMSGRSMFNRFVVVRRTLALVRSMRGFRLENPRALRTILFSLFFSAKPSFRDFIFVSEALGVESGQ